MNSIIFLPLFIGLLVTLLVSSGRKINRRSLSEGILIGECSKLILAMPLRMPVVTADDDACMEFRYRWSIRRLFFMRLIVGRAIFIALVEFDFFFAVYFITIFGFLVYNLTLMRYI